jgi:hypothetical protein
MPVKDQNSPLMLAIRSVMNDLGPTYCYHPQQIVDELEKRSHWGPNQAQTPLRTVTSYMSEHPEWFPRADDGRYFLGEQFREVQTASIGPGGSTIRGASLRDKDRVLEIRLDPESPTGEKWAIVTIFVKATPYVVRVPAADLRTAVNQPDLR